MKYRDIAGFAYVWRHIPTGTWGINTYKAVSRTDFYHLVARWNAQQPTRWAYAPID